MNRLRKFFGWLTAAAVIVIVTAPAVTAAPEWKATLRVLDEDGNPMQGVDAGIGWLDFSLDPWHAKDRSSRSQTDRNGCISASGHSGPNIGCGARKEGYYRSHIEYWFKQEEQGRWLPWNPTIDLVLKQIVNPVPMYARELHIEIPAMDKPIGFDLIQGDWVQPFGKGQNSDFVFKLTRRFENRRDFDATLELSFSNAGDGIQSVYAPQTTMPNELRLPRRAPTAGYEDRWVRQDGYPGRVHVREDQNYFFRVRSRKQGDEVVGGWYGKIHNEIRFDAVNFKTTILMFTYYLNPDGTTNVEFDPKRNLFKNLKSLEEVNAP
jgi:hypothetical protein